MSGGVLIGPPRIATETNEPQRRRTYYRSKEGDMRGSMFDIPKGDHTRFFTIFPHRKQKRRGSQSIEINDDGTPSGPETLHEAVHLAMSKVYKQAFHNHSAFYNVFGANNHLSLEYERTEALMVEGKDPQMYANEAETELTPGNIGVAGQRNYMDAIKDQLANMRENGTRYLENQYILFFGMRWSTTVSRMISVRHQYVKRAIQQIQ